MRTENVLCNTILYLFEGPITIATSLEQGMDSSCCSVPLATIHYEENVSYLARGTND